MIPEIWRRGHDHTCKISEHMALHQRGRSGRTWLLCLVTLFTGRIICMADAGIYITQTSILGFFSLQGRLDKCRIWRGRLLANFHLHWCRRGDMGPQNSKFHEILEYKRPIRVCPLSERFLQNFQSLWLIPCWFYVTSAKEDMFSSLFVCLSATLRKNFRTNLHEIFREDWQWASEQMVKFWWRLDYGSRYGSWHW